MQTTKRMPCLLLAAAAAMATTVLAQDRGARAQPMPQTPSTQAPQTPRQQQGTAIPQQNRMQVEARERVAERARLRAQDPAAEQRWQGAMRNMLQHEHTYRMQVARLERIQQIYRQQQRLDRVQQLSQLRQRLEARYQERMQTCRQDLGEEDFAQLRDRIAEHDQLHLRDRDRLRDPDLDRDRDRDRTRDTSG